MVLYQKNNEYEVHFYASAGFDSMSHEAYRVSNELTEKLMKLINDNSDLKTDIKITGVERFFKYRNNSDELISAYYNDGPVSKVAKIASTIFSEAIMNENRIIPEYALNWRKFQISSTGMSMKNCYEYCLEKMKMVM